MRATDEITKGTPVRFTHEGKFGLLETPASAKFEDAYVIAGDTGRFFGKHMQLNGWWIVEVEGCGRRLYCPCHSTDVEIVED